MTDPRVKAIAIGLVGMDDVADDWEEWIETAKMLLESADKVDPLRHGHGNIIQRDSISPVLQGANWVHNTPKSRQVWPDD